MFEQQITALKTAITVARGIVDHKQAIDALTNIIEEPLITKNKRVSVAAILFLDNDKRADVYARRAGLYESLALRAKLKGFLLQACEYYQCASEDMAEAINAYEALYKKNACRNKRREIQEQISTIYQQASDVPTIEQTNSPLTRNKKRQHDESAVLAGIDSPAPYRLRGMRLWNSKQAHETLVERLEQARVDAPKQHKMS